MELPLISRRRLESLPPNERKEAEEALAGLRAMREANPLAFYNPHPKQEAFHGFTARRKGFFGGNQSGKTTAGLADDVIQAIDLDAVPDRLKGFKKFTPPFECRIMAETFPVLETTLIPKLQDLLPVEQLVGKSWRSAYEKDLRVLHFANGSKFFFMTYEQEVRKMGGATLDRVHFDEEPPLAVFNECRMRVMVRKGDLLFTMTPVFGMTWTHEDLWEQRGVQVAKDVYRGENFECVTVDMEDNPSLTADVIEEELRGLSKEERLARKSGHFVALHGLIYGEFDRDRHIAPTPEVPLAEQVPENVNVVVGIDPGLRHPAAVVWAYLDAGDSMVVFHEGLYEGWTAKQVSEEIHRVNSAYRVAPLYYVIDPAARNKSHETGRSLQMEYADNGIVAIAGQHEVRAGINRVRERFQKFTLHVRDNCPHLIKELTQYRWKAPPRSGEATREAPVKIKDDLVDALRYLVMSRPYAPEQEIPDNETPLERAMRLDQERSSHPSDINIGQFSGIAT